MKLFLLTMILLLWTTKRHAEATFPGIFLLPFMPSTKLLQKVSSTQPPSSTLSYYQLTTKIPARQPNNGQFQSDFVKLHKWLEQTKPTTTYVSTNKNENSKGRHVFHLLEGSQPQPQLHQRPVSAPPIIVANPTQNFSPSEGHVAALATHGSPQRSLAHHQLMPLTFPPTSTRSITDSHNLPKIISLPPLSQQQYQQQQQQQHLPQSSSHYSTSSVSYSFSQGYRQQGYGPPKTTKIVRHVSVFVAPPDIPYNSQNRQKIRVQGEAEKHVNIIFIKSPDSSKSNTAEIELPPSPEQKTYVYVLNKADEGPGNVVVNTPEPPKYNPPDVFFIKYKGGQQDQGQQYGVPPRQQQHESPPQQQYESPPQKEQGSSLQQQYQAPPQQQYGSPPQQQYGSPSQQQHISPPQQQYGPPPSQQHGPPPQIQYGSPPQQYYVAPPQQKYESSSQQPQESPPPQQQQHNGNHLIQQQSQPSEEPHQQKQPPSLEYVAPSNQNFNYTLPSLIPLSPIIYPSTYNTSETGNNNSKSYISLGNIQQTVKKVSESSHIAANRRIQEVEEEEESHYHAHNLNYVTAEQSQSRHNWQNKQDYRFLQKNPQHNQIEQEGKGLYAQMSEDITNNINIKSNSHTSKPTKHHRPETTQTQQAVSPTFASTESVTKKTEDAISSSPTITTRSFFPSPTPILLSYTTTAMGVAKDGNLLVLGKNTSSGESSFKSGSNIMKKIAMNSNEIMESNGDITVLTMRNLTTAIPMILSNNSVGDNVKKKREGSPRNISGRPDDFRPYQYAPSMGHNHFGISSNKDFY